MQPALAVGQGFEQRGYSVDRARPDPVQGSYCAHATGIQDIGSRIVDALDEVGDRCVPELRQHLHGGLPDGGVLLVQQLDHRWDDLLSFSGGSALAGQWHGQKSCKHGHQNGAMHGNMVGRGGVACPR